MKDTAYLYLLDGMSDWEPGLAIAELNTGRFFKQARTRIPVLTAGATRDPITTMGGLVLAPDLAVHEVDHDSVAVFILPGGSSWLDPKHAPVLDAVRAMLEADVLVAAICGATEAMANAGMLDHRRHTSNSLDYLKAVFPNTYRGEEHFRDEPATTDHNLITATFSAPHAFAYHILDKLDVFSAETLEAWYRQFTTHDPAYTFAVMQSLPR